MEYFLAMKRNELLISAIVWMNLMCILEKEMATDSSVLAWRIPWMEEPGRL